MRNWVLNAGVITEVVLALLLTTIPGVTTVFGTGTPSWPPWLIGLASHLLLHCVEELRKLTLRRGHKWFAW